jgi:hypothetical protein
MCAGALKMSWFSDRGRRKAASRFLRALLLLAAGSALAGNACRKPAEPAQDISVEESIAPQPVHSGEATISIHLADSSGHPLAHARIQVEGDMDHPGMAPVFSDAQEAAPGTYRAPLTFTMGGDWVVLLHITLADGRRIERQRDVKGVVSR